MKIGDKLYCYCRNKYFYITFGNIYTILDMTDNIICIIDDFNTEIWFYINCRDSADEIWYYKNYFYSEDSKEFRRLKLKKLYELK